MNINEIIKIYKSDLYFMIEKRNRALKLKKFYDFIKFINVKYFPYF